MQGDDVVAFMGVHPSLWATSAAASAAGFRKYSSRLASGST
jgi:hypothetical protein